MKTNFMHSDSLIANRQVFCCSFLLAVICLFLLASHCKAAKPKSEIFTALSKLKKEYDIKPLRKTSPLLLRGFGVPASYSKTFLPVKEMKYLGHAITKVCIGKNVPKYHVRNSRELASEGIDYFKETGQLYVFDFKAVTPQGGTMPLRVAFNEGDSDTNDGFWGEVWNKDTNEKVVDIFSTADTYSTIIARTKQPDIFDSTKIPILEKMKFGWSSNEIVDKDVKKFMDNESFYVIYPPEMKCSGNRNLAKIVALSLKIFSARLHAASPKRR